MEFWRLSAESRYGAQDTDPDFRAALLCLRRLIFNLALWRGPAHIGWLDWNFNFE
jgi:hypothetical protein